MKKILFASLILLGYATITETKEAFVPYYMKKADSSKIDAIKVNQASCGCDDGDCSNKKIEVVARQSFINLVVSTQKLTKKS